MKIRRTIAVHVADAEGVGIDMTPMIDCIFLLIVFFITAGKFSRAEGHLDARAPTGWHDCRATLSYDVQFISVVCRTSSANPRDGVWLLNNKVISKRSELVAGMRRIVASCDADDKIKVSLDGDSSVCLFWVISALDAAAEAGLPEVVLAPPRIPLAQWPLPLPKGIR
ncbi:MAG: biopolymer transporter ExbD [Candidatus Brocadiia bacterium]